MFLLSVYRAWIPASAGMTNGSVGMTNYEDDNLLQILYSAYMNFLKKIFQKEKANLGFWGTLQKPIIVLAPMADVTDVSFRQMFATYGKPDVTWTEFVSADGLCRAPKDNADESGLSSHDVLWKDLQYFENERPIVAQLFSGNPEYMEQAAYEVTLAGFDGIDINMGCPDKTIQRQHAGAFLIKDPKRATEIIESVKRGIKKASKEMKKDLIPVSVKTRLGFNTDTMEEWVTHILKSKPAVLTIHARTRKEMSKAPAQWNRIKDAVELRNALKSETLIFGNGDVLDLEDARQKVKETGCDGVMVGRGIFGNPWFFDKESQSGKTISIEEKLKALVEHTYLFEKYLSHKSFALMKKHYKAYIHGFEGAKELRNELMEAKDGRGVEHIVQDFISK
jgi:tRNA-dihydrouridine synthase B